MEDARPDIFSHHPSTDDTNISDTSEPAECPTTPQMESNPKPFTFKANLSEAKVIIISQAMFVG